MNIPNPEAFRAAGEFLLWLQREKGYVICEEYKDSGDDTTSLRPAEILLHVLLAEFFEFDVEAAQERLRNDATIQWIEIPLERYPVAVIQDRYSGAYSGAAWIACSLTDFAEVLAIAHDEDSVAARVPDDCPWAGVGDTPDDAVQDLLRRPAKKETT